MPEKLKQRVFDMRPATQDKPPWHISDDWIDLYVLLQVRGDVSSCELEEAIISRGADCLCCAVSRSGTPQRVLELERHIHEFRPILLNCKIRRRYDEQLALHRAGGTRSSNTHIGDAYIGETPVQSYSEFLDTLRLAERTETPATARGCLGVLSRVLKLVLNRAG